MLRRSSRSLKCSTLEHPKQPLPISVGKYFIPLSLVVIASNEPSLLNLKRGLACKLSVKDCKADLQYGQVKIIEGVGVEGGGGVLTESPPSQSTVISMLVLSMSQNLTRNSSPAAKKRFLVMSN